MLGTDVLHKTPLTIKTEVFGETLGAYHLKLHVYKCSDTECIPVHIARCQALVGAVEKWKQPALSHHLRYRQPLIAGWVDTRRVMSARLQYYNGVYRCRP
jgi:hypothetical protein